MAELKQLIQKGHRLAHGVIAIPSGNDTPEESDHKHRSKDGDGV